MVTTGTRAEVPEHATARARQRTFCGFAEDSHVRTANLEEVQAVPHRHRCTECRHRPHLELPHGRWFLHTTPVCHCVSKHKGKRVQGSL